MILLHHRSVILQSLRQGLVQGLVQPVVLNHARAALREGEPASTEACAHQDNDACNGNRHVGKQQVADR